ncbi:MAG TPA: FtsX-like permease family protein [Polyangiaceae bacterium]|jgi:putative ABC transport system permease protein|nr:FtsX-like permease family protein [Polyangiaceae bacterium]
MIPISYNIRSLAVRRTTTVATALGIALVVFVLASSLMLGSGIEKTMGRSGRPDHAFVLRKGSDAELSSSIENRLVSLIMAAPGVAKDGSGAPLGSGEVTIVITLDKLGTDNQVSNVQVRGVTEASLALRPEIRIVEGRPARPGTDEVIVGKGIRGRFKGLELNSAFDLKKNRPMTVVGVFDSGGSSFESEIWADIDTVRTSFGREGLVSSVTVKLESKLKFDAFAAAVGTDKQLGLEAMRESAYYEKQSEDTRQFVTVFGVVIAVLFSAGAMIGAMITMYAAVSQRRREVGTLRALGFSRTSILISFVLEAVLLALAGGILGALAATAMSLVKFSMMNFATFSEVVFSFDPTPSILGTSLLFGGAMGLFGGILPAIRAARTSPIEAMRG